ncbi:17940_t:CDS:2 [Entrophospora sp. SA101]|nr:17940_t:CDS:2 [Entrophospora sp. SA101]
MIVKAPELAKEVKKYWKKRYDLFSLYDEGIIMDEGSEKVDFADLSIALVVELLLLNAAVSSELEPGPEKVIASFITKPKCESGKYQHIYGYGM